MKVITLKRISHTEGATFGTLIYRMIPFCVTLELPWRDNERNISCIPEGIYTCNLRMSPKRKREVYELVGVPGRDLIQIHTGNKPSDIAGCILVGEKWEPVSSTIYSVWESAIAFKNLERVLDKDKSFLLDIVPAHRNEYIRF